MNPDDLAELLAEANRIRKAHPKDPLTKIDAWIRENAPEVGTYAALRRRVEQPVTAGAAAQLNARPGQIVQDATRVGARPRVAVPQTAINSAAGQNEVRTQATEDTRNLTRGLLRGATLNFDDNLARMLGAGTAPGQMYSPEGQANFEQFQQQNPMGNLALNVVGGLPTGGLLSGAAKRAFPAAMAAQGTAPAIARGAGFGALYGGASAAGDGGSLGDVALSTAVGAGIGGAIPAVVGTAKAAGRALNTRFNAAQEARSRVEQMGNLRPLPNGEFEAGDPITLRQRLGDFFDPTRVQNRTQAGLGRLANKEAGFVASGRGAVMTPMDVDPTQNGILGTLGANSVRQNSAAAGLAGIERLGTRGAQTRGFLQGDIADTYTRAGITPPLVRSPSLEMGDRGLRMATAVSNAAGVPAPIRDATLSGQMAARARRSVADRVDDIAAQRRRFANSEQGYAGLRPVIQPGSGGVGASPEVLDQTRLLLARNAETIVDENTRKFLQQTNDDLARLQGGVREDVPAHIKDVGKALKRMNNFIDAARRDQPLEGGIYPSGKLPEIEQARDALLKYADDGFRGPDGQTFSDIQRRYAQGKAAERAVQTGADLLDGKLTPDVARLAGDATEITPDVGRRVLNALRPEERVNAQQGIIARQVEKLRGMKRTDDTGEMLTMLVKRSANDHRESALLREAFPTRQQYQRALNAQIMMDAADQGMAAFKTTSPAQIRSAFERLPVEGRDEFRRMLIGSLEEDISNPKAAQEFIKRAGADIRVPDGEWMTKFRIVFGDDGAREMQQRILMQARMQTVERKVGDAAQNTAEMVRSNLEGVQGRGNASRVATILSGIARPAAALAARQGTKTELARLLSARGPEGMQAFREAVLRASQPVQLGANVSGRIPMLGGYLFGSDRPE